MHSTAPDVTKRKQANERNVTYSGTLVMYSYIPWHIPITLKSVLGVYLSLLGVLTFLFSFAFAWLDKGTNKLHIGFSFRYLLRPSSYHFVIISHYLFSVLLLPIISICLMS